VRRGKTDEVRLGDKLAAEVDCVYVTRTNGNRYQLLPKSRAPQPFLNTAVIATRYEPGLIHRSVLIGFAVGD
jgi:hypothetical protein